LKLLSFILENLEKKAEQEDGSSPEVWSCLEKEALKNHRQTQLNIATGRFLQQTKMVAHTR